jgi:glycosyltransferase involved in cell wall biosynthesis
MKKSFLENVTFVQPHKVIVQENPVCLDQVLIKAKSPLNDHDLNSDFICAAGRLIPEKGFSILIKAFSQIENQCPNLNLLIFGEGPEKIFLTRLIETLGLTNRVILKGWTSNPMPYFKHAKVCVVSSVREGFPNVLLEMMSVNPLVVSTLCAGGIETLPGILTSDVNNATELANTIKTALNKTLIPKEDVMQRYLQNRNPEAFIGSMLRSLQY